MMNQEDIFKKIGHILNELNEQYQYLAQNPAELNELELELFLANSSFLADHVQIIRKLNNTATQKKLTEHTESVSDLPVQQLIVERSEDEPGEEPIKPILEIEQPTEQTQRVEPTVIKPIAEQEMFKLDKELPTFEFILNENPSSDRFEFEEKSMDEIFDRPLSKEEEEIIAQKQKLRENDSLQSEFPEEDEIGPEPFLVPAIEEPSAIEIEEPPLAEVPDEEELPFTAFVAVEEPPVQEEVTATPAAKLTLNDILSSNTQLAATRVETTRLPVTDLKQAISLNDKLRYIRDLFNGYNLAYSEAIDLLNKMPDFKSADSFLQKNYAAKHNWAAKQETVDQFYELLNQRFPAK